MREPRSTFSGTAVRNSTSVGKHGILRPLRRTGRVIAAKARDIIEKHAFLPVFLLSII